MKGTMASREEVERFISAIRADEALRGEVERAILHARLLQLPDQVGELTEAVRRLVAVTTEHGEQLARLVAVTTEHTERLDRIDEALERLVAVTTEHTERLDRIDEALERLVAVTTEHKVRLDRLDGRFANFEGNDYERFVRENASSVLSRVGHGLRRIRVVDKSDLADRLDDALDEGRITQDERDSAARADVVATAVDRETGETVYVVAEASVTLHDDDVVRARSRSAIVARAFGLDAIPVAVCQTAGRGIDTDEVEIVSYRRRVA